MGVLHVTIEHRHLGR